jgi:methylthioribose-1-phosphate isomerase
MADLVNRASGTAAAGLPGLTEPLTARPVRSVARSGGSLAAPAAPIGDDAYRSPYRLEGDALMLLDQRAIPVALGEVTARRGTDVAYYARLGVTRGGPLLAQVAAYGLALTAAERAGQPQAARTQELRRTQRALANARPSSRLPIWAMARLERRWTDPDLWDDGAAVAAALREEADAIATEFQANHAAIAGAIVELLSEPPDRPLGLLVHGDPGALSGGLVGTGITAVRLLREQGRELHVYVTETRPSMEGARLASWELRQAGIEHKVIPDAAVAWLFEREAIDAVLIAAEWVAANGDTGAVVGSQAIAAQVAAVRPGPGRTRPRIVACGVSAAIDPETADGEAIPVDLRPVGDLTAYLANVPIRATGALLPASDVIPAAALAALVTERGVLAAPTAEAIAELLGGAPVPPTGDLD